MEEYQALMRERAMELARTGRLTVRQISERTGVCERTVLRYVREASSDAER